MSAPLECRWPFGNTPRSPPAGNQPSRVGIEHVRVAADLVGRPAAEPLALLDRVVRFGVHDGEHGVVEHEQPADGVTPARLPRGTP